ncbi:RNA polymerase sigma factor [Clostridium cochlearium]|uniref:RNA polymerase sigma factor n=1 Tax=Clostridium cochlearium TaxID=1494 RepID=UPI00156DA3C3|nr:sigma-70 family RNA polymerase sigma factor [Clostridium cochlearium]MBV1820964.1 sigma-70 family RNA polymerase sigma factor [Bacteroidales bacterium MSK.15.36]MCG4572895.1 sigma-70 family RNA polymerase sigma factor [Clostridium cochlearium]MCG4581136.1 sigma-70 family RNA polymerase sigma factor [Clostridium cochlearium]NSJ92508.1 sigma-70 family RNA polymerase sigma factor [Coprococcus sp. MSK.21.13]
MNNLYCLVKHSQSKDDKAILRILDKFSPLIKKYSRKLNYDGADSDLTIALIEIINKIPISTNKNMTKEYILVSYIATSLVNKYIYLSKKHQSSTKLDVILNEEILYSEPEGNLEDKILLNMSLDRLPKLQQKILKEYFYNDKSCLELARELNVSRQSINQTKNRALNNLKKYLCNTYY